VGESEGTSGRSRPFPKRREIDAENLADAALHLFDLAVHLARGQVDEPGREVGDQRLELEQADEVFCGGLRMNSVRLTSIQPIG